MGRHRKTRYCKECGEPLPDSRTDRLYCSMACRHRHSYKSLLMGKEMRKSTITALDRNHMILSELLRKKVESINLQELQLMGFSSDFMTCCRRKPRYSECVCYDIVYNLTADRIFSITKIVV